MSNTKNQRKEEDTGILWYFALSFWLTPSPFALTGRNDASILTNTDEIEVNSILFKSLSRNVFHGSRGRRNQRCSNYWNCFAINLFHSNLPLHNTHWFQKSRLHMIPNSKYLGLKSTGIKCTKKILSMRVVLRGGQRFSRPTPLGRSMLICLCLLLSCRHTCKTQK